MRIRFREDPCRLPPGAKTAAIGLLFCCALVACTAKPPADLVLVKGHIYTSNPAAPWAEAVAIREGKILLAGTNAQVEKYRGPGTQVIDLGGRMAMPGIIDTHTHFLWGSAGLAGVLLYDAKTVDQVRQILLDYAKAHPLATAKPDEKWIYGAGWNYGFFPTADGLPTKALLDEAFPDQAGGACVFGWTQPVGELAGAGRGQHQPCDAQSWGRRSGRPRHYRARCQERRGNGGSGGRRQKPCAQRNAGDP